MAFIHMKSLNTFSKPYLRRESSLDAPFRGASGFIVGTDELTEEGGSQHLMRAEMSVCILCKVHEHSKSPRPVRVGANTDAAVARERA